MKTTIKAAAEVKATAIEVVSSVTQVAAEARGQVRRSDRAAVVHGCCLPVPGLP